MTTIRSRCAIYTLSAPGENEVREYFSNESADMETVEKLMSIYGENIGKIENSLTNEKRYAVLTNAVTAYKHIRQNNTYEVAKACSIYNKNKEDFKLFMDDLKDICHRNLSQKNISVINSVQKYNSLLATNVNLNLAIENFAIDVTR